MKNNCEICVNRTEPCAAAPKKGKCSNYKKDRFCLTCTLYGNGCPQGFSKENKMIGNCGFYVESK